MKFDGDHVDGGRAEVAKDVDEVATNCNAHMVRIVFLRAMIDDNVCVGDNAIVRDASDFVVREKKDSVSTNGNAFFALCQAMEFFGHCRDPKLF